MDIVHLIQSAVAPVFLLSGVGVTLGVLTNRLARIVDRARLLEMRDDHEERAESTATSLRVLARRAHYINSAIALCTIAALLVSLVVMSLFASAFVSINLSGAVAILFVAAMICLTAAFGAFFIEVRIATQALRFGAH
jgi:CBS domain containing-hemolysin-like protein